MVPFVRERIAKCLGQDDEPEINGRLRSELRSGIERLRATCRLLLRRVVVEALAEPSLNLGNGHPLALGIVGYLIAVDFAQIEISGFRVSEIKSTHA